MDVKGEDGKITKVKRVIDRIQSRRKFKNEIQYEVFWQNLPSSEWIERTKLIKLGFEKKLIECDEKTAAAAGLVNRPLTTAGVRKHLEDLGLEAEYGEHTQMRGLSGGQKVKVVIAAAMWNNPHILVLDEPTNYLDRDSLAALAMAIKDFGGGVVIISHNRDFVEEVCRTLWFMVEGKLRVEGEEEVDEKIEEKLGPDTYTDAAGNTHEVKKDKELTKGEIKKMTKKIKKGEDLTEDEENFAIEFNL